MEIKYSEHIKLVVDITHEMIQDWRECRRLVELEDDEIDCNKCSMCDEIVEESGMCEIPAIREELNRRIEHEKIN